MIELTDAEVNALGMAALLVMIERSRDARSVFDAGELASKHDGAVTIKSGNGKVIFEVARN